MFPLEIQTLARLLIDEAREKKLRLVAAESCTGGLVAGAICSISGASDVFERGFVTYTNRAKSEMLGVPGDLIADHGAVSEVVARMMAEGALEASNAHVAVSITVAGPMEYLGENDEVLAADDTDSLRATYLRWCETEGVAPNPKLEIAPHRVTS